MSLDNYDTYENIYQVGGSLPVHASTYLSRLADENLYENLLAGNFCYVLNSRQMGKSSLRVQTMKRLRLDGVICTAIDLTSIGSQDITPEQWYAGIVYSLASGLELLDKFNLGEWWQERQFLAPLQRLGQFLSEIVLQEVQGKIVIFIDEIDSVLSLSFNVDDFFALIRSCYQKDSNYERLAFALFGVASPTDLIRNNSVNGYSSTPFNIGQAIDLQGFQLSEALPLATGLGNIFEKPEEILRDILDWTGGQPFLTQKVCKLVLKYGQAYSENVVSNVVQEKIIKNWEGQDEPEHLKTIRDRLLYSSKNKDELLNLYHQILQEGAIDDQNLPAYTELRLTGLVVKQDGKLKVYNRIYAEVFNLAWLENYLRDVIHSSTSSDSLITELTESLDWRKFCQNALVARLRLTTNPLTTGDGTEFSFNDIYVPLGLVEKVKKEKRLAEVAPQEGSQFYQPEEVTRSYKNDEFFSHVLKQGDSPKSKGRRLAIIGEPGAGKTTLLQKIAQWVTIETENDLAIWVSLADLQGRTIEEYLLQKWVKDTLSMQITPVIEDSLISLFNSGNVWLLLDGIDEMGDGNPLATIANQISGWLALARIVVSCRQNVWDAGKNALEGFDVYRSLDFDYPHGMGKFIQCWFIHNSKLGKQLLTELGQVGKERIRDMVKNPLRLALLCRAWQIRQGGLPENKAGLYRQFVETIYEWKQAFPTTSQQRKDLNMGLGRLALRGMEQSESRFRLKEDLVTEILGEKDEPLCKLALQLGWLNLVGVAVENPDERVYAFYHPTFQEYFASLTVDDWSYFLHHVPDNPSLGTYRIFEKQWKEVILLWFGRENVGERRKEAFIEKLINFDDGCGTWNYKKVNKGFYEYRAYFLAGAIIPEFKDSYFADEIVSQIVNCVDFLKPIAEGAMLLLAQTDRQRAIKNLIQLLDETPSKSTRRKVADILGYIGVGNERVITYVIQLLDQTSDESTRKKLTNILGKIAVKNDGAITCLIQLLDETSDESTCREVADSLSKIAVENDGAITRLMQLLDETSDDYIRERVADSLGKIAVGNKRVITCLIQLLDQTSNESTRKEIGNILGEIAVGNDSAITCLIQLLNETSDDDTRTKIADSLGKIAVGNNGAITRLIQLFNETSDEYTRREIAYSLGKIAVGNDDVIARLIQMLDQTSDEYTRREIAYSLGRIAVGNDATITRLIQMLDKTSDDTRRDIAYSLGHIAVGNEPAIICLIQFLNEISSESTRLTIADSLGKIAVGNNGAITRLIQMLDETSDNNTCKNIAYVLGNIATENDEAITCLIQMLDKTCDDDTRREITYSLGKIGVGNEDAIDSLVQLLDKTCDESTRRAISYSLGKIGVGNEDVITRLIKMLGETSDDHTRLTIADSLRKIGMGNENAVTSLIQLINETSNDYVGEVVNDCLGRIIQAKQQYYQIIFVLKQKLNDKIYFGKFDLYAKSYRLIWQYAQNLSYPEFYIAWHQKQTGNPAIDANHNITHTESAIAQKKLNQSLTVTPDIKENIDIKSNINQNLVYKTFEFEIVTVNNQGEIIKRENQQAKYFTETLPNNVTLDMVEIPGGSFIMGSPETETGRYSNEGPQHQVTVEKFYMGKYPITQAQYEAIMGKNPSTFKGENCPVEKVNWEEAKEFCAILSKLTGRKYVLPSEAQWEYAARAGTKTIFHYGETITKKLVQYDCLKTEVVGNFPPNTFGLYDMHGNVWEWCEDSWHENYLDHPKDGSAWVLPDNENKVIRGGSWVDNSFTCRVANRDCSYYLSIMNEFGFRVCCLVENTD